VFERHCQVVGDASVTKQQEALSRRDCHRPDAEAARFAPVIVAQRSKRFRIASRYADADSRCRRGRKWWKMPSWSEVVDNGSIGRQKALGVTRRLAPLHAMLPLTSLAFLYVETGRQEAALALLKALTEQGTLLPQATRHAFSVKTRNFGRYLTGFSSNLRRSISRDL
jgi:hypothetical protein